MTFRNQYIFLVGYYDFRWIGTLGTLICDAKVVLTFFQKNISSKFWTTRAIISDEFTHFVTNWFNSLLSKYEVGHKVSLVNHL